MCLNPFAINELTNSIVPTKILEYLSCGKPVLSTPLKGTIELLPNDTFGIVYSESKDFISSIEELMQDKTKLTELGNNGFSYIKEHHYWDKLSDQLIQIFHDVIKNFK